MRKDLKIEYQGSFLGFARHKAALEHRGDNLMVVIDGIKQAQGWRVSAEHRLNTVLRQSAPDERALRGVISKALAVGYLGCPWVDTHLAHMDRERRTLARVERRRSRSTRLTAVAAGNGRVTQPW